ncbi:MAG: hypothetical protein JSU79_08295 [Dehalococcoidales bacterium]|nr:MAG: hypothetical protein JSU79_08295 [Dehalococcoidales bacterium]
MTDNNEFYEKYPISTVILSNTVSLAIYGIGTYIMFRTGWIWMGLYILYIILMEIRLLRGSCPGCYYYGKICAFGKGRLACLVAKKGSPNVFTDVTMNWKSLIPDMLVTVIPLVAAIVLMIIDFHWIILALMLIIILLTSVGNGFVRGSLACKYCRQRELGCPAEKLFNREKSTKKTAS